MYIARFMSSAAHWNYIYNLHMHYLWFCSMVSKILLLRRGFSNTMTAKSPKHHAQLKITSTYKSYLETPYTRQESIKNKFLLNTAALFPIIEHGKPFKLKEQRTKADPESSVAGIFVSPTVEAILCTDNPTTSLQTRLGTRTPDELVTLTRSTRHTHTQTHTHTHRRTPVSADSVSAVYRSPKKFGKLNK